LIPLKDNIPTRSFPVLTVALIVINVIVFVFAQHGGHFSLGAPNEENLVKYGLIPYEVTHPGKHCELVPGGQVACEGQAGVTGHASSQPNTWVTMITSIFMHGGLLHIAGNMLFLWIFGNNIEDSMSKWRFLVFYLLGGIIANFAQVAVGPDSTAPGIGASGAIAAVLGGYALLYPRARVITAVILIFFITLLELPALLVLGGWFLLQILDASINSPLGGGVAYFAHIGGFVFGLLVIKLFANNVHTDYDRVNRLPVY
jgi:membrane associated rhomboid family serine protease